MNEEPKDPLSQAKEKPHYIGYRQTVRALEKDEVLYVLVAADADEHLRLSLAKLCADRALPLHFTVGKGELGKEMGIEVPCAVVAVLKK